MDLLARPVRPSLTIACYWQRKNWIASIASDISPEIAKGILRVEKFADLTDRKLVPPESVALIEIPVPGHGFEDVLSAVNRLVIQGTHVMIGNAGQGSAGLEALTIAGAFCFEDNARDFRRLAGMIAAAAVWQTPRLVRWDDEIRQRLPWRD